MFNPRFSFTNECIGKTNFICKLFLSEIEFFSSFFDAFDNEKIYFFLFSIHLYLFATKKKDKYTD